MTGIIFSSSLVASGRRTDTNKKDIVYPGSIFKKRAAKKIYQEASEEIIENYNYFLSKGLPKDEASKILQYGIYGTGIIQLPIESIIGLKREYESEINWMPEEIGYLLEKIEKESKRPVLRKNLPQIPTAMPNLAWPEQRLVDALWTNLKDFAGYSEYVASQS